MPGEKYDCEATLTDEQVVEFCKNGFMMLEEAVPGEVNRRTVEFLGRHPQTEPNKILGEEWFADAVVKNPRAAGAVRSLLGRDFKLPAMMSNHRVQCPQTSTGGWHRDGGAVGSTACRCSTIPRIPRRRWVPPRSCPAPICCASSAAT